MCGNLVKFDNGLDKSQSKISDRFNKSYSRVNIDAIFQADEIYSRDQLVR